MSTLDTTAQERYATDVDLFTRASLLDPYDDYRTLRDVGPVAYMTQYRMWATTRYDEVKRVLGDPKTFSSASGIAMSTMINEAWADFAPCKDGDDHARPRRVMMKTLGGRAAMEYQPLITAAADKLVAEVVERGEFDAVLDLAEILPTLVMFGIIGHTPDEQERTQLLHWATDTYNCCGPEGTFDDTVPGAEKLGDYVARKCTREALQSGGIGAATFAAVDRGEISEADAMGLFGAYNVAALDTTGGAIGSLMMLFANNPDQWALVRDDPSLIPSAILEAGRVESPAQWFTRVTTREVEFDDVTIPAGTRMLHSYGAANRDERHFPDPDRFDVRRNPTDSMTFGYGPHACPGRSLSGLEIQALVQALVKRVDRIEPTGEPRRHVNNLIRSLESLPVKVIPR